MSLAYFPLYADDFEADTAHLTLAEDGAYNRLLRLCWRSPGCQIPADKAWVYRRMRAYTDAEKAVIDTVLDEFFRVEKQCYSNARLSKEFKTAKDAHEKRKNAGKLGGNAKALKTKKTESSNATAKPEQCSSNQNQNQNHIIEDTNVSLSSARDDAELGLAFEMFAAVADTQGWPVPRVLSKTRKSKLRQRLKECGGLGGWHEALEKAAASPLCNGDNDRGWVADLDFLLQQKSFTKLMEGSYDNRPSNNRRSGGPHNSLMAGFAEYANSEPDQGGGDTSASSGFDDTSFSQGDSGGNSACSEPLLRVVSAGNIST